MAKFLNQRLVTTPRFAPGSETRPDSTSPHEAEPSDSNQSIDKLVRVEEATLKAATIAEEVAELARRRQELMERLADVMQAVDTELQQLTERCHLLADKRRELTELDALSPDTADLAALRRFRQAVQTAHLELLKFERDSMSTYDDNQTILSLTWGQLARLGIGLSWPLLLGILGAAALIILGLFAVVRM